MVLAGGMAEREEIGTAESIGVLGACGGDHGIFLNVVGQRLTGAYYRDLSLLISRAADILTNLKKWHLSTVLC